MDIKAISAKFLEIDARKAKEEFLRIRNTVNTMVDQLNSFASEINRVAK